MRIDPREYKAEIDLASTYHNFNSVLNTAALITLSWFSFSSHSPLSQQNPDPNMFNAIAYPIYAGLLLVPSLILYFTLIPFVNIFTDDNNITDDPNSTPENHDIIKNILCEHSQTFHIPAEPMIQVIKNNATNALAAQLSSCTSQHLLITSAAIGDSSRNAISLKILLAHELMHYEYDSPYFSIKRFQHLLYLFNLLFLSFGYMPMQIGFSIAGAATSEFQPAIVCLPLIGLFLTAINALSFFHENRNRERNADYCALFSGKKFENEEYDKHRKNYESYKNKDTLFGKLFNTHPDNSERIALLNAAQESPAHPDVGTI